MSANMLEQVIIVIAVLTTIPAIADKLINTHGETSDRIQLVETVVELDIDDGTSEDRLEIRGMVEFQSIMEAVLFYKNGYPVHDFIPFLDRILSNNELVSVHFLLFSFQKVSEVIYILYRW